MRILGKFSVLAAMAVAFIILPMSVSAQDVASLRGFDGTFNFAWVGNETNKNLDVGASDFLVVFRANTAKITRSGIPKAGLVCKKPFGNQPGYNITIDPEQGLRIYLNDSQRESLGKGGYSMKIGKFFTPGKWISGAVVYQHSKNRVIVYRDGKKRKEFNNIMLDNLDNCAPLTVGVANTLYHIRYKGHLAYAGVFKFADGLPAGIDSLAAQLAKDGKAPAGLAGAPGVKYSFWRLDKNDKGAEDLGNNGNFLYYMPENEKLRFAEMKKEVTAKKPRTIYVDMNNTQATDDGEGTAEKPFKTIQRGAGFARAGDTVIVKKGIYRESVSVSGGRPGAPIKIIGEKGVVVEIGDVFKGWKKTKIKGVYVLKNYKGQYLRGDPMQTDARREPGTIVFINGYPLDWVDYEEDLIPGSYTIWPREKYKPKDIYIFPMAGENVKTATIEINERRGGVGISDYIELDGISVSKGSIGVSGRGCVVKNCTTQWGRTGLGIRGADHKITGNRVLWAGNTGVGGGGASGCLIENNYIAYANYRIFNPGWHGGGAKMIPSNIDNVIRKNEWVYNWGTGFWYDAYNAGNLIEYNNIHDNAGLGLFDEINWDNRHQYNVVYNNWCTRQNRSGGSGLVIGETSESVAYRNIVFNCERGIGIMLRGYASRKGMKSAEKVINYASKYPHYYVSHERQKKWLGKYVKYYKDDIIYMVDVKVRENISFNNHECQLWTMRDYRVKSDPRNKYYSMTSDNNYFYYANPNKIVRTGFTDPLTLNKWREASGMDKNTIIVNPFKDTEKLPEWARKLFDFKKYASMRSAKEIADMNVEIHDSIGSMIFKSRIVRAAKYRKLKVRDLTLRAFVLDVEGKKALALWRTSGAGNVRVNVDADSVVLEDRWLRRKEVTPKSGKVVAFVGQDPIYLIGVGERPAVDPTYKAKLYGTSRETLVYKAPAKIKLDGDIAEWKRSPAKAVFAGLTAKRDVIPDKQRKWGGAKDVSAKVYAGWSPKGVYFAFDVTDNSVVNGKDKVELFIDCREVWRQFFTEYQHPGTFHIQLSPAGGSRADVSFPPLVFRNRYHRKKPVVGIEAACAARRNGYTIEMFLPWTKKNFRMTPLKKDTIMRIGILVTDVDQGKPDKTVMKWNAFTLSHSNTSGWLPVATK